MDDFNRFKEMLAFYFSRTLNKPLIKPEHAYICITNKCNLGCKICNIWRDKTPVSQELEYEEYKKLLDELDGMKIKHVIFSGGEPFLRKDIFEIINYAGTKNFEKLDVTTNATLIDDECAKKIIRSKMTTLTVSLDGFEKEHDYIRGRGVFRKVIKAVEKLDRLNNRDNFSMIVNTVITGRNYKKLPKLIDFFKKVKFQGVSLQPVLPDNTNMASRNTKHNDLWLSKNDINRINKVIDILIKLKKSSKQYDDFIHVNEGILKLLPSYFFKKECNFECFEGLNRIVITPYGDVWTCKGIISNIRKEPLKKIWASEKAKEIRKKIFRCKIPCLQGCVYLYDYDSINKNFDSLLFRLKIENEKTKKFQKNEFYNIIDFYEHMIKKELKLKWFGINKNYIRNTNLLKNFKLKLDEI